MQAVQNMAAKITLGKRKYDSATSCLVQLHWLPIRSRIEFKIVSLVHKCLHKCLHEKHHPRTQVTR